MASKSFSFRLPDEIVQFVESSQLEGETLNQTSQRLFIDFVKRNNPLSTGLTTVVDVQELVKQEVAASLGEVRSQLEELRGGSFSRSTTVSTKSPDVDILEVFKQEVAASLGEVRSQLEELRGKSKAR
ncbi:hypothetical protein [Nostoc sp.]|uniref:hypothetical protein n=1 Tax=Nostoc sp. TaxID=1180 RepID=UPI002FF7B3ED